MRDLIALQEKPPPVPELHRAVNVPAVTSYKTRLPARFAGQFRCVRCRRVLVDGVVWITAVSGAPGGACTHVQHDLCPSLTQRLAVPA